VKKDKKARRAIGTIMPVASAPYEVEVEISESGTVEHEGMAWVVVPNSIWTDEKKRRRVILPEALAESLNGQNTQAINEKESEERKKIVERKFGVTITGSMMTGRTYFNARMFFLYVKMNLLEQLFKLQNRKPWFKESSTWIQAIAIGVVALILVWMTITNGHGFDNLQNAITHWTGTGGAPGPTANPTNNGHQVLTPSPHP
jgi:hypothetical protein